MRVYEAETMRLLGDCQLDTPAGPFMVYRGVDDRGEYYRIKLEAVTGSAGPGLSIAMDQTPLAMLLPAFVPAAGVTLPGYIPQPAHLPGAAEPQGVMGMNLFLPKSHDPPELVAKVAARLLLKLDDAPWHTDHPVVLEPGELAVCVFSLPPLPAGHLFLIPAAGLPVAMESLLHRVAVTPVGQRASLYLQSDRPVSLSAGTLLGRLESRSLAEFPEGMREKVFQGHLLAKLEEIRGGGGS